MLQHLEHLKIICPSLNPICCNISLVALPLGTAPYNSNKLTPLTPLNFSHLLTGSVNIVFRWEVKARKAQVWNIIVLTILYTGCGLGYRITVITTNSAYKISIHVKIAQIIPQMSLMHQNMPPQHLL